MPTISEQIASNLKRHYQPDKPKPFYSGPDYRNVPRVGTGQLSVTSSAQQVSSVSRSKAATKITNLGSTDIYWGTNPTTSSTNGDLLPGGRGNWVSIPNATIIFVVCASGVTGSISWAEAYND